MSKTLLVGASGTVGQALAEDLRQRGHAVVRATSKPVLEADQVHLNLVSGAGIAAAVDGVAKAFLMAPPGYTNQDVLLRPLVEAAQARKLEKVVLMSALGANANPEAPLRKAELQLEASGVPFAIIRPNWFMQNFNSYWREGIRRQGEILVPAGKAKCSFIDARDIAAVAAELLSDSHRQGEFDLTGAEALDHDEVAAILSRVSGKPIRYRDVSEEEMRGILRGAGLPADYTEMMLVILGYLKAGYAEGVTDCVPTILGRAPISFARYAEDHREAWVA